MQSMTLLSVAESLRRGVNNYTAFHNVPVSLRLHIRIPDRRAANGYRIEAIDAACVAVNWKSIGTDLDEVVLVGEVEPGTIVSIKRG